MDKMNELSTSQDVESFLNKNVGWALVEGRAAMKKEYVFSDFNVTFGFMTLVAIEAEKLHHHPEWFNVYNRLDVTLTTHDAKGITGLDLELARKMEMFYGNLTAG